MTNTRSTTITLDGQIIRQILHVFSGGLDEWEPRFLQSVSPTLDSSTAMDRFKKVKQKMEEIGIDTGNNLIFLADSRVEKAKQRIVVDDDKFNDAFDSEKMAKLKYVINEMKYVYSKQLEAEYPYGQSIAKAVLNG